MKKIILIDGNNLMFRSYYATFYSGANMKTSTGLPTNALFSFTNMINKIIKEENPLYVAVAFDVGKNFRKKEFSFYKEGRQNTPDELKMQMPYAREILTAMGIKYLELEPYEADDIIGTLVKMCAKDADFDATIISSDKDLLQLINFETNVKLLKQTGFIRFNEKTFKEEYGVDPINMIDLKALMGDSSDNIPGVKGIGEKGAIKLLKDYQTIENLYEHIDEIKGSIHDKLVTFKGDAFMSKKLATIYCDVPLKISLNDLKYDGPNNELLYDVFSKLEFTSLLSGLAKEKNNEKISFTLVNENINVVTNDIVSLYIECDNDDYTSANIVSASLYDGKFFYYFSKENIKYLNLTNKKVVCFDSKKCQYLLNENFDVYLDYSLCSYLNGDNIKDDISFTAIKYGFEIPTINNLLKIYGTPEYIQYELLKVKFLFENYEKNYNLLKENKQDKIYERIELPLSKVLLKMEKEGIKVSSEVLDNQKEVISKKLEEITAKIYEYAGENFNISSPKQLGEILFEKMQVGKGKKNKTSYKTDEASLEKLANVHPIINLILEYRGLSKLKSTYIDGLKEYIVDGKIHTIFKQTVARTGRLSSIHPNLQNIPVKTEEGKQIRKAFIPSNDVLLSLDYSQIELRILASTINSKPMIDTFNEGGDIHARVAADIHNKDIKDVTKAERSAAKAVIFGIVYGISGFGLGENLHISKKEADEFIKKYYHLYPEVKEYMEKMIAFAKENGFVYTNYGRKRVISEINDANFMVRKSGERMAINTPIQGSAADIIKMAMIKIDEIFTKENIQSKLVLQIHDELIFDVKNEELEKVENIVKDTMENVVSLAVPLKVSTDVGTNWYDLK